MEGAGDGDGSGEGDFDGTGEGDFDGAEDGEATGVGADDGEAIGDGEEGGVGGGDHLLCHHAGSELADRASVDDDVVVLVGAVTAGVVKLLVPPLHPAMTTAKPIAEQMRAFSRSDINK